MCERPLAWLSMCPIIADLNLQHPPRLHPTLPPSLLPRPAAHRMLLVPTRTKRSTPPFCTSSSERALNRRRRLEASSVYCREWAAAAGGGWLGQLVRLQSSVRSV